ncbi:hypothetical protein [Latilactobacillus curvatus]|uniref:hypothetical protein n=1 Tax=Latilactobacillus curvatus TaxID=28038 RepID=UPI003C2E1A29
MRKKLGLDKSIAEIARTLKAHIGSNGKAHLPVSSDLAGFMTPEQLEQHNQLFVNRKDMFEANVQELPSGFYRIARVYGHPLALDGKYADWISYANVYGDSDGPKLIELWDRSTGRRWQYSGSAGKYWMEIESRVTLWEGNSKMTSPVTLAQSVKNQFTGIYVSYSTDQLGGGEVRGSIYGARINTVNDNDDITVTSPSVIEAILEFPTDTTARLKSNSSTNFAVSTVSGNVFMQKRDGGVNITGIYGIR